MRLPRCCIAPRFCFSLATAGSGAAFADDETAQTFGLEAPRVIRSDWPGEALHSMPGYRNELTEVGYRWWATAGRADLGLGLDLGLGTVAYTAHPTTTLVGLPADAAPLAMGSGTVLTLDMRYRTSASSALYADAAGVRGPGLEGDRLVGKLGIEFQAAQSRWNLGYGGLGLKLSGDTRMLLRVRKCGVLVSMRASF